MIMKSVSNNIQLVSDKQQNHDAKVNFLLTVALI